MSSTPLDSKTVRPGSLGAYAQYYYSNRASANGPSVDSSASKRAGRLRGKLKALLAVVLLAGLAIGGGLLLTRPTPAPKATAIQKPPAQKLAPAAAASKTPAAAPVTATNYCANNTLDQLAVVSISQRHMWACEGSKTVYDSPVITGIDYLAADKTPTGTYHVYGKYTDTTLRGSDTTGSWSDPVSYWMPFLHNKYGSYGFHDATWRADSDFGTISPDSSQASHGCVELPLATASWLYGWIKVGTAVTIES